MNILRSLYDFFYGHKINLFYELLISCIRSSSMNHDPEWLIPDFKRIIDNDMLY